MEKLLQLKKKFANLSRSKRIKKMEGKRVKPNDLIEKATFNLNNTRSLKYDYASQHMKTKV